MFIVGAGVERMWGGDACVALVLWHSDDLLASAKRCSLSNISTTSLICDTLS